jgi:hypothetical protein
MFMYTKLTLRLDERLIRHAKGYARRSGKSVSALVADYFAALEAARNDTDMTLPPKVRSLRGALASKGGDEGDYRRYLERKHR